MSDLDGLFEIAAEFSWWARKNRDVVLEETRAYAFDPDRGPAPRKSLARLVSVVQDLIVHRPDRARSEGLIDRGDETCPFYPHELHAPAVVDLGILSNDLSHWLRQDTPRLQIPPRCLREARHDWQEVREHYGRAGTANPAGHAQAPTAAAKEPAPTVLEQPAPRPPRTEEAQPAEAPGAPAREDTADAEPTPPPQGGVPSLAPREPTSRRDLEALGKLREAPEGAFVIVDKEAVRELRKLGWGIESAQQADPTSKGYRLAR